MNTVAVINGVIHFTSIKAINLPPNGVKKLVFLYDNGKTYTAAGVKAVNFNTSDITGKACIEYASKTGVHRVYREDLAAVTAHYDDMISTQKLLDKVVARQEVRMQKRPVKTIKG